MTVDRRTSVILLAGAIKPPPLREELGLPIPMLPLTSHETLLMRWLRAVASLPSAGEVRIVVNSDNDAALLTAAAAQSRPPELRGMALRAGTASLPPPRIMLEPSSWRGTAGLLRDVAESMEDQSEFIAIIETTMLPPHTLLPLVEAADQLVSGVIGAVSGDVPNGVCMFRRDVLEHIPRIGYFDLKEQFLPRLNDKGLRVRAASFEGATLRLRDRRRYLEAVRMVNEEVDVHADADVDEGARIEGACVIEAGARIGKGAIIHESILMSGCIVDPGVIISRSVIGPGAHVRAGERLVRRTMPIAQGLEQRRRRA